MKGCFDESTYRKERSGSSRKGKGGVLAEGGKGKERIEEGRIGGEKRGEIGTGRGRGG